MTDLFIDLFFFNVFPYLIYFPVFPGFSTLSLIHNTIGFSQLFAPFSFGLFFWLLFRIKFLARRSQRFHHRPIRNRGTMFRM